jgi:hypothetical protein
MGGLRSRYLRSLQSIRALKASDLSLEGCLLLLTVGAMTRSGSDLKKRLARFFLCFSSTIARFAVALI